MPVYRYSILLIEDHNGLWTAKPVQSSSVGSAVDEHPRQAVSQLRDAMLKLQREWKYLPEPYYNSPELLTVPVSVRPEYKVNDRSYPCSRTIEVKIPCIRAEEDDEGTPICSIPQLDIEFNYYNQSDLRKLVKHYVSEQLNGRTPDEITRLFPNRSVKLVDMSINVDQTLSERQEVARFPTLNTVAVPLGAPAVRKLYSRALERDREVNELSRRINEEKASILLVGPAGVGKTSVLVDAARKVELKSKALASGESKPRRFWQTSGSRIIAGMMYLGQWQERCEEIIEELTNCNGILCLDNLVDVLRATGSNPQESIAAFLLPFIQYGELRIICEATPEAVTACEQLFPAFLEPFQVVRIKPFSRDEAIRVLHRTAEVLTAKGKTKFEDGMLERTHDLFARFMPYQSFPGKVVEFIKKLRESAIAEKRQTIGIEDTLLQFMTDTGLNEVFLHDELPLKEENVDAWFRERIIGQTSACEAAASLVSVFKAAINDPQRPVGVLFFCGPTGVGKTALALALARYFFGSSEEEAGLIRLDMSEYATPGAAERMLGESNREPSDFINRIRRKPFSVILLDEIEKADPEVFDLLLNVLDEGRLVDKFGRVTSFRSAIIIFTSNVGASKSAAIGFDPDDETPGEEDVKKFFRPEFFNRIDRVVTFHPLNSETILAITRRELAELIEREGLARRKITIDWPEDLVAHLAREGFDARWGARKLLRTIEEQVVTPLAAFLLEEPALRNAELVPKLNEGRVTFDVSR